MRTTPTQIAPQISLTGPEALHILNCKKFDTGSLWNTSDTPGHPKQ